MGGRILIFTCKLLVAIPGLLRITTKLVVFLNKYIFRYRHKAIIQNLSRAFPEKTDRELQNIAGKFYILLVRYFREMLEIGFGNKRNAKRLVQLSTPSHLQTLRNSKNSTIIMASHFGNWEILSLLPELFPDCSFIAFYKPVRNKSADLLMQEIRTRFGVKIYPSEQAARVFGENKNDVNHYLFIADQTPHNMNGVYWNEFLNQTTPWFIGAEKLAKRMDWPVYYVKLHDNNERAGYIADLICIENHSSQTKTGDITGKYAHILEVQIKEKPEYWLWSHRRWKRSPLQ